MSADFWAGYLSGAIGIVIGNPLDIIKVKLQAGSTEIGPTASSKATLSLLRGSAAPILAYGGLNSLLFVAYNRSLQQLDPSITDFTKLSDVHLYNIWIAGATGGLASWVVSAPSEMIKCRAQLAIDGKTSSFAVFDQIWKTKGVAGLYYGGLLTSLRDSIGYGFYFWSYEFCHRTISKRTSKSGRSSADTLLSGGIAGIVTWMSIYPLDVVKTILQAKAWSVGHTRSSQPMSALEIARSEFQRGGLKPFYKGFGICSIRAFIVNAVQWFIYEEVMQALKSNAVVNQIET